MRVTVTPIGDDKRRFFISTHLEAYHYNGEPVPGQVVHAGRVIPLWLFKLHNIEEEAARQHFIWFFMMRYAVSDAEAVEHLCSHCIGIARDRLVLALTESEEK